MQLNASRTTNRIRNMIFSSCLLCLLGCVESGFVQFRDTINSESVRSLEQRISNESRNNKEITLILGDSPGGEADAMLQLADSLRASKVKSVFLTGPCLSACAELLALSGLPIQLGENGLVGFHNGPILTAHVVRKSGFRRGTECILTRARKAKILAERVSWDAERAAGQIQKRVKYYNVAERESEERNCGQFTLVSKHRMWFPTIEQLTSVFSMDVYRNPRPNACNQSVACVKIYVSKRWRGSQSVAIGDQILYLNNGALP